MQTHALDLHSNILTFTSYAWLLSLIHRCGDALRKNKALIQEEQLEFQQEMEKQYQEFQQRLAPLINIEQKTHQQQSR